MTHTFNSEYNQVVNSISDCKVRFHWTLVSFYLDTVVQYWYTNSLQFDVLLESLNEFEEFL